MPTSPAKARRFAAAAAIDGGITLVVLWGAMFARFEGHIPARSAWNFALVSPLAVIYLLALGAAAGLYHAVPKYSSLRDALRLGEVVAGTGLVMLALSQADRGGTRLVPMSVALFAAPAIFVALGSVRVVHRIRLHGDQEATTSPRERVLLVGAGDAGEMVARDLIRTRSGFEPVGFLDDDPKKLGHRIHGIPVLAGLDALSQVVASHAIDQVLVTMPSAPSGVIRGVLEDVTAARVRVKLIPSLADVISSPVTAADLRDVDVADLLGRKPAQIDTASVAGYLRGRCVLVTGAAGSIGSELARQIRGFGPRTIVLLDSNETDLFYLTEELRGGPLDPDVVCALADIRDPHRVEAILAEHPPAVIFHAAAYKHVPVMELQPVEAVTTNVIGTRVLAEAAVRHGCERFILVSTDKAVHPVNVMGATKRVAEMIVSQAAVGSDGVFAAVRFGNVLGSRGSVVPIFARQIQGRQAITVTHPEATRYFMTIDEAAALIVQAGALARGGETFVLDMGEPVKIMDLAERMRDLLGDPGAQRSEIVVTGLRPGEKLHEDLWHANETLLSSGHARILRAAAEPSRPDREVFDEQVARLELLARQGSDHQALREALFAACAGRWERELGSLSGSEST